MRANLSVLAACALLASTGSRAADADERQLVLVPSAGWTPELREDLALGLQALPPAARNFPGGPLEVELHEESSGWGLGDATHPAFTHGLQRLHLYAYRADDDRRASSPLDRLSAGQQLRLWRRRAIVHAVIRRWDDRLHWSARAGWEGIAGWKAGRPLLVYPWAFSRREGIQSAELDLATFAEELLAPAESIAPDSVRPNDRVRCRELSRSRFLDERLAGLDPTWQPPRSCPRFDFWADPTHVLGLEVAFAAPSTTSAQSVFGHLLLTIVRDGTQRPGTEQVMEFSALVSPFEPRDSSYLVKGLTGGFRGVFALTGMDDVRHEALELEQRSLRRFRLELSPDQRLRVLERIWELDRVGYLDYRFLDANCATMLRFLLAPALGDDAPRAPLTPWETPTQVLDALGPRLRVVATDEPTGDRARRVAAERRRLVAGAPATIRAAVPALGSLDGASQAERASAYASLAAAELPPADDRWRARVLLASLRIERHALDSANVARIRAERATVLPGWKGPTTDELIAARQRRFEEGATPRARAISELDELLSLDAMLRAAPRRPFNAAELRAVADETAARETFDAAAAAVAGLSEEQLAGALDDEHQVLRRIQEETSSRSVPEGGHGHGYLGVGVNSAARPLLRLRAAALAEELGDQRLRGFGARTELHVLDVSLELAATPSPVVSRGGVTLFSVRGLGSGGWGWGGRVDYAWAPGGHDVTIGGDRLWALVDDERFANFLVASAGVRAGLRLDPSANALLMPRVAVSGRVQLPGSFGNAVRLEAAWLPRLRAGRAEVTFEQAALGTAQLLIRLGSVGGFALTARADLEVEWRRNSGLSTVAAVGVELD